MTVEIAQEVKLEDIANLLVSAFDPAVRGSGYWCEISGDRKPEKMTFQLSPEQVYRYCDYPLNEGGELYIKDIEADKGETYTLNLASIRKGLEIMAREYPRHWADFIGDNDDATTADVFVQCCVLGEVLYG